LNSQGAAGRPNIPEARAGEGKKERLDAYNEQLGRSFFEEATPELQRQILGSMELIESSPRGLVPLSSGAGSKGLVFLFVDGLSWGGYPWYKPLALIQRYQSRAYLFKRNESDSLRAASQDLADQVGRLHSQYPDRKIIIIGYCTGGVITAYTVANLLTPSLKESVYFHTVASPLAGYGAPAIANIAKPFVGKMTIDIGRGVLKDLPPGTQRCHQWITANCGLDIHACKSRGEYPQMIGEENRNNILNERTLCGPENTTLFDDETHATIFSRVIEYVFQHPQE